MIRVAAIVLAEVMLRLLVEVMLQLRRTVHLRTQRPVDRHASWPAIVASKVRASIAPGAILVRALEGGHVHVMFAFGSPLIRASIVVDPTDLPALPLTVGAPASATSVQVAETWPILVPVRGN